MQTLRIAMAQMAMNNDIALNVEKSVRFIKEASGKADLIFFPELQLTPFYPLHRLDHWGVERKDLALTLQSPEVEAIRCAAKESAIWVSPNFFMQDETGCFRDMNLVFSPEGKLVERASMVHVLGVEDFWETDYYTPSADGFKVVDLHLGSPAESCSQSRKVGIVICFDRHLPESIRSCALKGAELIIIPTVNMKSEPMEMFMQELRVQAFQNNVFIAMCNRVGQQDRAVFAGESIIVDPEGNVVFKADDTEQMIIKELDLGLVHSVRSKRPYIRTRREASYY